MPPDDHGQEQTVASADGALILTLAQHAMRATLEIRPEFTGEAADLLEFLKTQQVVYGVDAPAISQALKDVRKTRKPVKVVAARGTAPTNAEDGRLELKFSKTARQAAVAESEKNVDFREVSTIIPAKSGQLLAVLIPAKDGIMGTDVHGKAVLPEKRRAHTPHVRPGHNVRLDDNQFFATCDGLVKFTGRELHVEQEYVVQNDVDFSVGNIRFSGIVTVRGNVRPGFTIEAAGDVHVAGEVNDARIISGANVTVGHGLVGNGNAEIIAKGEVSVGFVENSRIEAGGGIKVRSHTMHGNLFANDVINVANGKGAIIGGEVRSGKGIQARVLGSESVQGTHVALGGGIEQDNKLRDLRCQLAGIERNMQKIQMSIGDAIFQRLMKDPAQLAQVIAETRRPILQKLMDDYTKLKNQATQLNEQIKALEQHIAEVQTGTIHVAQAAFQGTIITIGHLVFELKQDYGAVTFYADFKEGAIKTR